MATYTTPPDISQEEKIIGGLLTFKQFIFILAGLASAAIFSFIFFPILGTTAIVIGGILFIPTGFLFALLKIKKLMLFQYLKLKRKHRKKVKKLPNKRKDYMDLKTYQTKNKED